MLNEKSLINGLIILAGSILGPYFIYLTLEGNYLPVFALAGIAVFLFVFVYFADRICVLPAISLFLQGNLNFFFGFSFLEISSLLVIVYYVPTYIVLKKRAIDFGPRHFWIPAAVITAIVIYHGSKFGLRIFGSALEGSRPALLVLLATATYICGINIPSPSSAFMSRLPWYFLLVTCVSSAIPALTTYFPSWAPAIYHFINSVNVDAYVESTAFDTSSFDIARLGFFAAIGGTLQLTLVSYFPPSTWWRPSRWICALVSLLALSLVLLGAYRIDLFNFLLTTLFAAWCYSSWRVLLVLPVILAGVLGLGLVQETHPMNLSLPMSVQRTLSFLPGNWDADAVASAASSNEFRSNIQRVYLREYFDKSPLLGNGFAFDPHEEASFSDLSVTSETSDHYYQAKAFITTKTFHIGWISLYDAVGAIGGVAFLAMCASMLILSGKGVMGKNVDRKSPLFPVKVWFFSSIASGLIIYFVAYGNFQQTFTAFCIEAIVLIQINNIERKRAGSSRAIVVS